MTNLPSLYFWLGSYARARTSSPSGSCRTGSARRDGVQTGEQPPVLRVAERDVGDVREEVRATAAAAELLGDDVVVVRRVAPTRAEDWRAGSSRAPLETRQQEKRHWYVR